MRDMFIWVEKMALALSTRKKSNANAKENGSDRKTLATRQDTNNIRKCVEPVKGYQRLKPLTVYNERQYDDDKLSNVSGHTVDQDGSINVFTIVGCPWGSS